MQISTSKTFKEEYDRISKFIAGCENESLKNQVRSLLIELTSYVRKIDSTHNDIVNLGKLSDNTAEDRTKLMEIRKKIFRLIEKN